MSDVRTKDADDLFVSMLKHETPDGKYGNEILRRLRKLAEIGVAHRRYQKLVTNYALCVVLDAIKGETP